MGSEGASPLYWPEGKELPRQGDLRFLWYPDSSNRFAGYGLVAQPNRPGHLVGLLMVDRPQPVSREWLKRIEATYGSYQLTPMTKTGERGIVCQMRVIKGSQHYLLPLPHSDAKAIQRALKPLLAQPPNPILKCSFNATAQQWQSEFWVGLPPEMQAVFEKTGYGCFAVERNNGVGFIAHAAEEDIARFRGAPVLYHWELARMPTAPLIRFQAVILDDPRDPYALEHFLNVTDTTDARMLGQLVNQEELVFDFFGQDFEYQFSKHAAHPANMRQQLHQLVVEAIEYAAKLPPEKRDVGRAKAEFQRRWGS